MANEKYDNFTVLLGSGKLNWVQDQILAVLTTDVTFDKSDKTLADVDGTEIARGPVSGRSIDAAGQMLGMPVSFSNAQPVTAYQMLLAKQEYGGPPQLLAFYDIDDKGAPLGVQIPGMLILRPTSFEGADPPVLGVWLVP